MDSITIHIIILLSMYACKYADYSIFRQIFLFSVPSNSNFLVVMSNQFKTLQVYKIKV